MAVMGDESSRFQRWTPAACAAWYSIPCECFTENVTTRSRKSSYRTEMRATMEVM
jgi:hypothetical protein